MSNVRLRSSQSSKQATTRKRAKPKPRAKPRRREKAPTRPELPIVQAARDLVAQLPDDGPAVYLSALRVLEEWDLPGCMSELRPLKRWLFSVAAQLPGKRSDALMVLELAYHVVEQRKLLLIAATG